MNEQRSFLKKPQNLPADPTVGGSEQVSPGGRHYPLRTRPWIPLLGNAPAKNHHLKKKKTRQIKIYICPWKESLHCEFSPWIRGPPRGLRQITENVSLRQSGRDQRRRLGRGARAGCPRSARFFCSGGETNTYLLMKYNCSWKCFCYAVI